MGGALPQPETVFWLRERGERRISQQEHARLVFAACFFMPSSSTKQKKETNLDARPGKTAAAGAPRRPAASGNRTGAAGSRSLERGRGRDRPSDHRRERRRYDLAPVPRNSLVRGPFRRAFPDAEQPAVFKQW